MVTIKFVIVLTLYVNDESFTCNQNIYIFTFAGIFGLSLIAIASL